MPHRNLLGSLQSALAGADLMHPMKDIRAIVSAPAFVADTDFYIFQDDEPALVFQ